MSIEGERGAAAGVGMGGTIHGVPFMTREVVSVHAVTNGARIAIGPRFRRPYNLAIRTGQTFSSAVSVTGS